MATIEITAENFQSEVLESDKPVILDFWAVWCGPCNMLAPTIEEISEERSDIKVGKVNTDQQMALAQQFRVASIPTVLLMKNGEVVAKSVGAVPKAQLLQALGL